MTDATTTYGVLLKKSTVLIGEVSSVDGMELSKEALEATFHSNGGWREFITSGLKSLSEFKAVVNYTDGGLSTLITDWSAGTLGSYTLTYANTDVWTFTALVTKIKPSSADAKSPDTLTAEITFVPSGTASVA